MTMRRALIACAVLPLIAACSSTTGTEGSAAAIVGRWRYSGSQTSGRTAQLAGFLEIRTQRAQAFDGDLSMQSTDASGVVRVIQGIVTGSFAGSNLVDFDLAAPDGEIRHVGTLKADTIAGSWTASDNVSIGTFRAVRER